MSSLDDITITLPNDDDSEIKKQTSDDESIDDNEENEENEENDLVDDDEEDEDEEDENIQEEEQEDEDEEEEDDEENQDLEDEQQEGDLEKSETNVKSKKTKKNIKITDADNILGSQIVIPNNIEVSEQDYNSDNDDEDEDFQKLDAEITNNIILKNHPQTSMINFEELSALTNIIRNKDNIIIDDLHKTIPILTKYEKARILGVRAKQINSGSLPFIDIKDQIIDGYLIAEMELSEKKIPFIVRRPLPNGASEYWKLQDLEIL